MDSYSILFYLHLNFFQDPITASYFFKGTYWMSIKKNMLQSASDKCQKDFMDFLQILHMFILNVALHACQMIFNWVFPKYLVLKTYWAPLIGAELLVF